MLLCPITSIGFIGFDCLFSRRIWDSQKWVSRNYMRQSELGSEEVLDFLGGKQEEEGRFLGRKWPAFCISVLGFALKM